MKMPAKVNKISLFGFRGATAPAEISFDTSKPIALIFGENGTGKSTIADAFDFVCNRGFGSLEDRSMTDQPKSHIPALGQNPNDLRVLLSTSNGDFTATLTRSGPSVSPSSGCPDARILRRSNILQLLNAQPKLRFEALKSFITVPGIEKSENALREACRNVDASFNDSVRAYSQAKAELEKFWTAEGKPANDALRWAKVESNKDIRTLEGVIGAINSIDTAFRNAEAALLTLDRAIYDLGMAQANHVNAQEEQKKAEAKQSRSNAILLKLLQDAKSYIASHKSLSQCPVCEQDIEVDRLVGRLEARVSGMRELSTAVTAVSNAKRHADDKKAVVTQGRSNFINEIEKLAGTLQSCNLTEISTLNIAWENFQELVSQGEITETLETKARDFWKTVQACRQPLLDRKQAYQKSIDQRNAVKGHFDTHSEKLQAATELNELSQKLKKMLEIVSQERKAYVEGILAAISSEVERLYTTLHPGEGIGRIRFYLKPRAIGSLEFDGYFQDVPGIPPQAYYSESHLDTLGICVFLALAKHFKTEDTIIVLDDVVTSVDGPHLDRFMSLLHAEARHYNQVIVMTHYRPWRDRYRWAKGPSANTQVIELGPWTLQNGLQTGHFITAVAELQAALAQPLFDRQAIASKAGIILESLLDFITLKYRCSVPRNAHNEYTLGDLTCGVDSKLAKVLYCRKPSGSASEKSTIAIKPLIDAATGAQWIRNCVGCHLNALGSDVSDGDVRGFALGVLALAENLICASCGTLPTRRPSGSYWQCVCGELELYPLVYPGTDPRTIADES
jgi:hypothetical protein